jgi:putative methyltransferase (TIGR04325 family)
VNIKQVIRQLAPPILLNAYAGLRRGFAGNGRPEWECVPEGWDALSPNIKGWNVATVVETLLRQWSQYVKALRGPAAIRGYFGTTTGPVSYVAHNVFMTFAYALTLASRKKDRLSILDWGGGLGHYYELSKALLPDVEIDYCCREVSRICAAGRTVLPGVQFFDDDRCLQRKFDLVFASSSLQYYQDWKETLAKLVSSTSDYLYITRMPVVENSPSFVVMQRPYDNGFQTEYLGWFFNRAEVLEALNQMGMRFLREFHIEPHPDVNGAPEAATHRGFLARRAPAVHTPAGSPGEDVGTILPKSTG